METPAQKPTNFGWVGQTVPRALNARAVGKPFQRLSQSPADAVGVYLPLLPEDSAIPPP